MGEGGDVEASLSAMDDKLRELQQELSSLEVAPVPQRIVRAEPEARAPGPSEAATAPDRAALPLAAAAADQARAIIADAQDEATRIVSEAAERVSAIATQIDDLERLRGELERSARALVDEYAAAVTGARVPAPTPRARSRSRPADVESSPCGEPPASAIHPPLW